MIRSYHACVTVILLSWVIWVLPGGTGAQSKPETEKRAAPRMRQTEIQEAELLDNAGPDAATKKVEEQRTEEKGGGRSEARMDAADEAPPEVEKDDTRRQSQEADALPLLAKITPKTSPQRAASLKLVEEGRKALVAGEYKQALAIFERAIAVDATNPYSHYFLARAHFFLGNYPESLNFLDVAESLLGWHKRWLAEIYVLKGRNAAAMGFLGRADTNYLQALDFDSYNRFAFERLTTINTMRERTAEP